MKRHNRKSRDSANERYIAQFLKKAVTKTRSGKAVYISKVHHERINKILHVIGKKEVSLFGYIYNVLEQHFVDYKDVIIGLYEDNREDIF